MVLVFQLISTSADQLTNYFRELTPHGAALELGGVDVDVVARRVSLNILDKPLAEAPDALSEVALATRCLERQHNLTVLACGNFVQVRRGGWQWCVLYGQPVADLVLRGLEAHLSQAAAVRVARPGHFGRPRKLGLDRGSETGIAGLRRTVENHGAGHRDDQCEEGHSFAHS